MVEDRRPGLVIFDCDGVLVDSEPIAARVDAEMLGELGWPLTADEAAARFVGAPASLVAAEVTAHLGRPLPPDWDRRFRIRFEELAATELTAVAGVESVLVALEASGLARCVASNSGRDRIEWSLRHTGLDRYFAGSAVFSGHDVGAPKPAPDVFVHAAASFGVPAARAVVIEDSRFGVEAARRAHMASFAYSGGLTAAADLAGEGTTVFADMADLPALLGVG